MDAKKVLGTIGVSVLNGLESQARHMAHNRELPREVREQYLQTAAELHDKKRTIREYAAGRPIQKDEDEFY